MLQTIMFKSSAVSGLTGPAVRLVLMWNQRAGIVRGEGL
jgi:hypothetical protein